MSGIERNSPGPAPQSGGALVGRALIRGALICGALICGALVG